ncbi:MAG TPA: hypothetical protein PKH07_15130, partial [bacterium]|nr:hypothetical protein [bacterium]
ACSTIAATRVRFAQVGSRYMEIEAKVTLGVENLEEALWLVKVEVFDEDRALLRAATNEFSSSVLIVGDPVISTQEITVNLPTSHEETQKSAFFRVTLERLLSRDREPGRTINDIPFLRPLSRSKPPQPVKADSQGNAVVSPLLFWSDSMLDVKQGQTISISAKGDVKGCHGPEGEWAYGPWGPTGGMSEGTEHYPKRLCALIGRIEGSDRCEEFLVGDSISFEAPMDGRLYLGVSDIHHFDNEGEFIATVSIDGKHVNFRNLTTSLEVRVKEKIKARPKALYYQLWTAISHAEDLPSDARLWRDSKTGKVWRPCKSAQSLERKMIYDDLSPGEYRASVHAVWEDRSQDPTPVGVSDPVELKQGDNRIATINLEGASILTVKAIDGSTQKSIDFVCVNVSGSDGFHVVGLYTGTDGMVSFTHLNPGEYTLQMERMLRQFGEPHYRPESEPVTVTLEDGQATEITVPMKRIETSDSEAEKMYPWCVIGIVTDQDANPLADVEISASCGRGTLFQTGKTVSGSDGKYTLRFGPGVRNPDEKTGEVTAGLQASTIYAFT